MRRTVTKSSLMEIIQMRRSAFTLFCPVYLTLLVFAGNASAQLSISRAAFSSPSKTVRRVHNKTSQSTLRRRRLSLWTPPKRRGLTLSTSPACQASSGKSFYYAHHPASPPSRTLSRPRIRVDPRSSTWPTPSVGTAVPVTITVSTPQPSGILIVTPSALNLRLSERRTLPPAAGVSIASSGAPITFSMTATTSAEASGFRLAPPRQQHLPRRPFRSCPTLECNPASTTAPSPWVRSQVE